MKDCKLMKGNYILFCPIWKGKVQSERPAIVKEIREDTIVISVENSNNFVIGINSEEIKPIPLTPEVLVVAGFDEWSEGNWKTRVGLNKQGWSKEFNYYQPYYNLSTYCGNVTIIHVHQLQNLYFALTGEELNIKL